MQRYANYELENRLQYLERNSEMSHYKCTICGYTYKPERGDKMGDVPAGTSFDDLPEDWVCPMCRQPKMVFEEVK